MIRLGALFGVSALLGWGSLINSNVADPSQFNVTTFASGLNYPAGVDSLSDGSVLVETSLNYGSSPGQLLSFTASGGGGGPVYTASADGLMAGFTQVGNYFAVGNFTGVLGPGLGSSITLLQPGATDSAPMTAVATIQLSYPNSWEHSSLGLAARPTPGVPGYYHLIINIGSEYDNIATPPADRVTMTGTGFSSIPTTNLSGDSLYMVTINQNGAEPAVTAVQQIATGIRNVFGLTFDSAGDLYFSDNGMDVLPPGSSQPVPPPGEPPQADELNVIPAAQLGVGTPPNFGFPNCYIQYAWGSIPGVPVGSGCVQPIMAFQPVTDSSGIHQLKGATQIALAPADFPAGFNNGVFIGFTGDGGYDDNGGVAYYDFATQQYVQFIESTNVANILGVSSTDDALFLTDAGTVYEITGSTPEPGNGISVAMVLLFAGWWMSRRRVSTSVPASIRGSRRDSGLLRSWTIHQKRWSVLRDRARRDYPIFRGGTGQPTGLKQQLRMAAALARYQH
jgi:glucose/arabinose dehydrogenase